MPRGTNVALSLRCLVNVPDVTGERTGRAENALDAAGLTFDYMDGGEPRDAVACTVTRQAEVGSVEAGATISLDFTCPLTEEEVRRAAESFAEKVSKKGETFSLGACDSVSDDEGRCEATYYPPSGLRCTAQIIVTANNDGASVHARNTNVNCD